jgi:hypothetical protein
LRAQGKEKEKGLPAWIGCGLKEEREREGERERERVFLKKILFQIHFSNIQTKSMHSKHDAQALINSKLF